MNKRLQISWTLCFGARPHDWTHMQEVLPVLCFGCLFSVNQSHVKYYMCLFWVLSFFLSVCASYCLKQSYQAFLTDSAWGGVNLSCLGYKAGNVSGDTANSFIFIFLVVFVQIFFDLLHNVICVQEQCVISAYPEYTFHLAFSLIWIANWA